MATSSERIESRKPDTSVVFGEEITVPGLDGWLADIERQGFAIIPDWIDEDRVNTLASDLRTEVNPIRELMKPDEKTVRAHNLLAKTRCVDDLVCDDRLVAIVQGVLGPHVQVSVVVMFDLLPGSKPQGLHQDDGLWPLPRPHPPFVVNSIIAVDEFTKENGATVVVPGSHKWHTRKPKPLPESETLQVEMKPGTLLIWTGALWHGGGANRTNRSRLAVDINYNLSYLRQQENQYIGVPRDQLEKMPEKLRKLIGYQYGLNFVGPGMVDLRDPLKMVDLVEFGYDINSPRFPPVG